MLTAAAAAIIGTRRAPRPSDSLPLWSQDKGGSLTGVVVDSGDGCTHVIPVSEGFVLGSSIQSIPVAGRDVTAYIQQARVGAGRDNTCKRCGVHTGDFQQRGWAPA